MAWQLVVLMIHNSTARTKCNEVKRYERRVFWVSRDIIVQTRSRESNSDISAEHLFDVK